MRNRTHKAVCVPLTAILFCLLALLPEAARSETFEQRLRASQPLPRAQLGWSVALDGATLAAGAPVEGGRGAVHVFERQGIDWQRVVLLPAAPAGQGDQLGFAVALRGNRLAVGAPGTNGGRGQVRLFRRTGGAWQPDGVLQATNGRAGDRFGEAVALDPAGSGLVAVGAPGAETGSGAVYLFEGGQQIARVTAASRGVNDAFGRSVALAGGLLVVGAPRADDGGQESGAVYCFQRGGFGWPTTAAPERVGGAGQLLGIAVAVSPDGRTVAAGGLAAPAVQLLDRTAQRWIGLTAGPGNPVADQFGVSVSLSNDHLVVGARLSDQSGPDSGTAFLFRRQGNTWNTAPPIRLGSGNAGDEFGIAVSVSGRDAAVGAYLAEGVPGNGGVQDAGAVHVFEQQNTVVQFEASESAATEGDTVVEVPLRLETDDSLALRGPVTLTVQDRAESATRGRDYRGLSGSVVLPRGTLPSSKALLAEEPAVAVELLDDFIDEDEETVRLTIQEASGAALGNQLRHGLRIEDDGDTAGVRLFKSAAGPLRIRTGEPGVTDTFKVELTSEPVASVVVSLESSDLGEGRVSPATLMFDADNWFTAQEVTVTGQDDMVADGPVEYRILPAVASADPKYEGLIPEPSEVIAINADDEDPGAILPIKVTLTVPVATVREDRVSAVYALVRVGGVGDLPLAHQVGVDVVTVDQTATANQDYLPLLESRVVFAAGTLLPATRSVEIPILDDCTFDEGEETFQLRLDNPAGTEDENLSGPVQVTLLDNEIFFSKKQDWLDFVRPGEVFVTDEDNVRLADMLQGVPQGMPLGDLGSQLRFAANRTGLVNSFALRTLQNSTRFVFNGPEAAPDLRNSLTVKKKMGQGNAGGFAIDIEESNLNGFGMTFLRNAVVPSESFDVFLEGDGNKPSASYSIPEGDAVFLGVASTCPITSIRIDEKGIPDESSFRDLRFGVPATTLQAVTEIPTVSPFGLAAFCLLLALFACWLLRR